MSVKLTLGKKTVWSYVNVKEPKQIGAAGEPKYSVCLLIDKENTKEVDRIKAAIAEEYENSKDKFKNPAGKLIPLDKVKTFLKDGDDKFEESGREEYKGKYFINATAQRRPHVYDRDLEEIMDLDEEVFSGCFGRAQISVCAYKSDVNKGITAFLNQLQKFGEGERLGGGNDSPEKAFSNVDDDDEDEEKGKDDDWD